jgi:hypothetical protein
LPEEKKHVFISHSSRDNAVGQRLCDWLESKGVPCWYSSRPSDLDPGSEWDDSIVAALDESVAVVLLFSKEANGSRWVKRELAMANTRSLPILPARLDTIPPAGGMEAYLATVQWTDLDLDKWDESLEYLVDELKRIGTGEAHREKPPGLEYESPERAEGPGRQKENTAGRTPTLAVWFRSAAMALSAVAAVMAIGFLAYDARSLPALSEIAARHWGFAVPLMYAIATYGVFHFLDRKASGPAKLALKRRIESGAPQKIEVTSFAIEAFDRIYGTPLFSWRAALRSGIITTAVSILAWYELRDQFSTKVMSSVTVQNGIFLSWFIFLNALSDYISLFFIRRWLLSASARPVKGLLVAALIGALVVSLAHLVRMIGFYIYIFWPLFHSIELMPAINMAFSSIGNPGSWLITLPALVVHLWYPVLAAATVATQALNWFFKAAGGMQWFLKRGQYHPFQAVGYVAALIAFCFGVILQLAWPG